MGITFSVIGAGSTTRKETPINTLLQKKIIVADVDETICETCQPISEEMANKINDTIQKGYQWAFISGTDHQNLQKMLSKITEDHHILATTGTNYVKIKKKQSTTIYNLAITNDEKKEITNAFEKLITHFNIKSHTTKEDQLQDRDSQITLSAIGRNANIEAKKQYDPDGIKRKEWIGYLKQHLSETKYDFKIGGTTSIDVTKKGLDKAWGIQQFASHHNILLSDILFFGDKIYPGGNDYPATKVVDCISVKSPQDTLNKLKILFP